MKARNLTLLFALLQLCVAFLTDAQTFTHEESMWHYIGRNWFRFGLTPYAGGVDNKSPLIFAVFGLSDALFGINYWFPRLVGVAVQSVGLYYLYKIARQLSRINTSGESIQNSDDKTALVATTVYGLSLMWRATGGKYVSFTETYAETFIIVSIYQFIVAKNNRQYFLSGLLAGFALGWRLSAGFSIMAVLAYSIFKKKNAVVPFALGIISPVVVLLLLALAAGIHLNELWQYAFAGNFGSGSTTDHSLQWKIDSFLDGFFYSEIVLFYPLLAAYFLLNRKYGLLTAWLLFEFIGINALGIYARPHFKTLLPVMSLMGGIVIAQFVNDYHLSMRKVLLAIWIIFFPKITEPLIAIKRMLVGSHGNDVYYYEPPYPRPNEQAEKELGIWIRDNTDKKEKVYVAGFGARVQLYSERLSPTIYFNVTQTEKARARLMEELNHNKPDLIAVPVFEDYRKYVNEDTRKFIDSFVVNGYLLNVHKNGYAIFRKK